MKKAIEAFRRRIFWRRVAPVLSIKESGILRYYSVTKCFIKQLQELRIQSQYYVLSPYKVLIFMRLLFKWIHMQKIYICIFVHLDVHPISTTLVLQFALKPYGSVPSLWFENFSRISNLRFIIWCL